MKKKVISLLVCMSLMLSICSPAFAVEVYQPVKTTFTYVDSEGTTCQIDIIINEKDNTVTTSSEEQEYLFDLNNNTITTTVLDVEVKTEPLNLPVSQNFVPAPASIAAAKEYIGLLQFKPAFDKTQGKNIYDMLYIYSRNSGTIEEEYTIHGDIADSITQIIGTLVTFFLGLGMLAEVAGQTAALLIGKLVDFGVIKVVGETVKKAFLETVDANKTGYELEATDPKTSRTRNYEGAKFVVISVGAHFNETYYSGYYPQFMEQEDVVVASGLYSSFFPYNFPGVSSYG